MKAKSNVKSPHFSNELIADQNLRNGCIAPDAEFAKILPSLITKAASKQTYYTIRYLVDHDRILNAYRAYAYFRWVDDQLDQYVGEKRERIAFVERQQALMDRCYQGEWHADPSDAEQMLVYLIRRDYDQNSGLQSYIRNMMAVMAFDAERRGRLASQQELTDYSLHLAVAVTEAMHYFIGHDDPSPRNETRYLAATAAHIIHILRDATDDVEAGYFNIPREWVEFYGIDPCALDSDPYQEWVKSRVKLARGYFRAGRHYLDQVTNFRCRLAGYAYIARFEALLKAIEKNSYRLQPEYRECKTLKAGLRGSVVSAYQRSTDSPPGWDQGLLLKRPMMKSSSAIVIGAGIGGIAVAAHLAQQGMHVTVFEKNQRPGGRCDHFVQEGHHFDTGPTLLIMPLVYEAEFAALGASLHEMLDLQRVDPTYHLVFDDSSQLALTSDLEVMCRQLEAIEPGSFGGFLRYLAEGQQHYQLGMEKLVNRDFRTAFDFFTFGNLSLLYQLKPFANHYRHMATYFTNPRLKAAFTFQDVYMGLSPFDAPATFSMMPYTELAHGVWYPKGGMYSVVEALMTIARDMGVEFVFETAVERIEVSSTRARELVLGDGRCIAADTIIANADLPYVYNELLPDTDRAERLVHKQFSCSVISFFWGVDKPYPALHPHTLFLVDDYEKNFESIEHLTIPDHPSLYIHAPTRLDPSLGPEGQDTLIAIVPVGHLDEADETGWKDRRDRARQDIFNRLTLLGIKDLETHIKFEVNYTPLSWRKRYNLMKGSTHGLAHTLTQLGYFRPHNRHPRYHNLYFVGASTHPGTGVPTALISAHLVADRIIEEMPRMTLPIPTNAN